MMRLKRVRCRQKKDDKQKMKIDDLGDDEDPVKSMSAVTKEISLIQSQK